MRDTDQIQYSDKYTDSFFEYRHVTLPSGIAKLVPKTHLMSESEWRNLGVQQSPGWEHYLFHGPEPHILLYRRRKDNPNLDELDKGYKEDIQMLRVVD